MPRAYGRLLFLQDGNSEGFCTASVLELQRSGECAVRANQDVATDGGKKSDPMPFGRCQRSLRPLRKEGRELSRADSGPVRSSSCSHFRPTRANFHEPSFCRFSKRMPASFKLTGSSFADILYIASTFPTSIAQPSAICTFV